MDENDKQHYQPACRSATPGGCSNCTLGYDCQRAMSGRVLAFPLIALGLLAVFAFLV